MAHEIPEIPGLEVPAEYKQPHVGELQACEPPVCVIYCAGLRRGWDLCLEAQEEER